MMTKGALAEVALTGAVLAAAAIAAWRLRGWRVASRLLLLAAAQLVVSSLPGILAVAAMYCVVLTGGPASALRSIPFLPLAWPRALGWALCAAALLIDVVRTARRGGARRDVVFTGIACVALAGAPLILARGDAFVFDRYFARDFYGAWEWPTLASSKGNGLRSVTLPSAATEIAMGTAWDGSYERAWLCAATRDGTTWCWDPERASPILERLPADAPLHGLSLGGGYGCGLDAANRPRCWRRTKDGATHLVELPIVAAVDEVRVSIDVGTSAVVCWLQIGAVSCCTADEWYRRVTHETPRTVPLPEDVAEFALDSVGGCASTVSGELWCWGDARQGRAGLPVHVPLDRVAHFAKGSGEACAVTESDSAAIHCLGADRRVHTWTSRDVDVEELAVAADHTCARLSSGRVECFAADETRDEWGALGPRAGPHATVEGIDDATGIAAALAVSCVLRHPGTVTCWGREMRF